MRMPLLATLVLVPLVAAAQTAPAKPGEAIVVAGVAASSRFDPSVEPTRALAGGHWCSAAGRSNGETLTLTFDRPTPITEVHFVGELARSPRIVDLVRDGASAGRFSVKPGSQAMDLTLDGKPVEQLTLRIVETEPGRRAKPTETQVCVSSLRVRAATPRPFVLGADRKMATLLEAQARGIDAALARCDEAALREAVVFPLRREVRLTDGNPQNEITQLETYPDVATLTRACRRTANLFGVNPWLELALQDEQVLPPGPSVRLAGHWTLRFSDGRWRLVAMQADWVPDDADAAKAANAEGMKLYRQKRLDAAADKFAAAIVFDPTHWVARYNLACVASLRGDVDGAVEQLTWLDRGWGAAEDKLAKAKSDPDLARVRSDPRVQAILAKH